MNHYILHINQIVEFQIPLNKFLKDAHLWKELEEMYPFGLADPNLGCIADCRVFQLIPKDWLPGDGLSAGWVRYYGV